MIVALIAAIAACLAYGIASILQAVATKRATGLAVVRQPLALTGLVLDGVAWLLSLVALERLPLFVVQPILASALVVVVLLAWPVLGTRPRPRDLVAVAIVTVSLTVLALAGGDQPAQEPPSWLTPALLVATGLLVAGGVAAYRTSPAWVLAAFGGLGYSGAAIGARAADRSGNLIDTITQPLAVVVVVCGLTGIICYLRGLERGHVGPATAILSVLEVIIPGAVGIAVLGDTIQAGWAIPAVVAVVAALGGCLALAASPANAAAEGGPVAESSPVELERPPRS